MFEDELKTIPDKPSETPAAAKQGGIFTGKIITDKVNRKQKKDFKASGTLVPKVFASRRFRKLIGPNI